MDFVLEVFIQGEKIAKAKWNKKKVKLQRPKTDFGNLVYFWLEKYFSGINFPMTFSLSLPKSEFYQKIYLALLKVPYAKTISYSELAFLAGYPKAARACGLAMAKNPLPVFIPCHRVVGKNSVGGYSPYLEIKKALLSLEMNHEKEKKSFGVCIPK